MKPSKFNIFLGIITLVTVFVWVGSEIWHTYKATTVKPDVSAAITPLDPKINESVFTDLVNRSGGLK